MPYTVGMSDDARYDAHAQLHGQLIDHVAKALEVGIYTRPGIGPKFRPSKAHAIRLAIAALEAIDEFESGVEQWPA
jgi:hypothetical protein